MSGTDRNQPCPCGSGQKYKRCCLRRQQVDETAARREFNARQRLLDLERDTCMAIRDWVLTAWEHDPLDGLPFDPDERPEGLSLFVPFACYDLGPGERLTWAEAFAASSRLKPDERRWLDAQAQSWMGIWQIRAVDPGRSLTVRDRLTGEVRTVFERAASRTAPLHGSVVGRVVEFDGHTVFSGIYPVPFSPALSDTLVENLREGLADVNRLPRRRLLRPDELRRMAIRIFTLSAAHQWTLIDERRPAVRLANTDGDPLERVEERYPFAPSDREAVLAGLARLTHARCTTEPGERPTRFQIERPGHAASKALDNTITAHVIVSADAVQVETNSRKRADAMAASLAAAGLPLGAPRRTVRAFELPAPGAAPRLQAAPPPELIEHVRGLNDAHYAQWPDDPLPALGGKTPRQAMRTKSGREKVDALLRDLAWHQQRMPAWQRVDVDAIAVGLGLPPLGAVA